MPSEREIAFAKYWEGKHGRKLTVEVVRDAYLAGWSDKPQAMASLEDCYGKGHQGLLPCPFCGGKADRIDIEDGENAGGSCIFCTACQASGNIEFGRKENFVNNWNRRSALSSPVEGGTEKEEPYGYVFQHEETGLQQVVDVQQVEWGFAKNNPRWQKIGPVYLHADGKTEDFSDYDAGYLNDYGGGDVGWWQDYLRAEIGLANDFWRYQIASSSPSAEIEALRVENERLVQLLERANRSINEAAISWYSPDKPGLWPSRASVLMDQIRAALQQQGEGK